MLVTLTDTKNLACSSVQYFGAGDDRALIGSEEFAQGMCIGDPALQYAEENPHALCVDTRRLQASEDFQSWYSDRFRSDHYLVGYTPEICGLTFGASIHVEESRPAADEALFRILFGHMVRATHLASRRSEVAGDEIPRIKLGSSGLVAEVNDPARQLLEAKCGLEIRDGRLVAGDRDDDKHLQEAVRSALGALQGSNGCTVARIKNSSGDHACFVKATSYPARATMAGVFNARVVLELIPCLNGSGSPGATPPVRWTQYTRA